MTDTQDMAVRHPDLDVLAARIETVRKDVTVHVNEHQQWLKTWQDMLARHAPTRAELVQHPSFLRLVAEELRLDADVLMYEIARWMASRPAVSERGDGNT